MMTRSPSPFVNHAGTHWRELWRRDLLSRSLIRHLGGFTPGCSLDVGAIQAILDVGCGTGAWTRTLARAYPHLDVLGIDHDQAALEMAHTLAFSHDVANVRFVAQDVRLLEESHLSPDRFDLIHLAFLAEGLLTVDYAALAGALFRLLRPGGVLVWTEAEFPLTTSAACEQLFAVTLQALDRAGQSFLLPAVCSPWHTQAGPPRTFLDITPLLGLWPRQAGYEQVRQTVAALEVSRGQPLSSQFVNAMLSFGLHIQPFLVQHQVISETACEHLREEVYRELRCPDFCGMGYVLTVSARKSVTADRSSHRTDVSSSQQEGKE